MKQEEYMNTTIIIGENAQDNWDIIDFESDYIWLHLNSFPSCHIIINDVNINDNVLLYAAQLCKHNTKYKNLKNVKVCYTKCSNLIKGSDIGSVIYKSKRKVNTIMV
jgi:predicted ribosome quality control (RQC) complex YloA/Tae2 family protein